MTKEVEISLSIELYVYVCGIIILAVLAIINLIGVVLHFRKKAFRVIFGLFCILQIAYNIFASYIWYMVLPSREIETSIDLYKLGLEASILAFVGGNLVSGELLFFVPVDIAAIFLIYRIAKKYIYQQKSK